MPRLSSNFFVRQTERSKKDLGYIAKNSLSNCRFKMLLTSQLTVFNLLEIQSHLLGKHCHVTLDQRRFVIKYLLLQQNFCFCFTVDLKYLDGQILNKGRWLVTRMKLLEWQEILVKVEVLTLNFCICLDVSDSVSASDCGQLCLSVSQLWSSGLASSSGEAAQCSGAEKTGPNKYGDVFYTLVSQH